MTYKKKLIEVAIPLGPLNDESAKEKSLRQGHPSSMHQWWARRPITSCRGVLLSQLIDDPSSSPDIFSSEEEISQERQRLFAIIEEAVKYENSSNDSVLQFARDEIQKTANGRRIKVLDPFSGSGTTVAEALRLGVDGYATELNPVATIVSKGRTEVLTRFSGISPVNKSAASLSDFRGMEGIAEDFGYYATELRSLAHSQIGHLYEQKTERETLAWIWTRTIPSPDPAFSNVRVPLCSSFLLSAKKGSEVIAVPKFVKDQGRFIYEVRRANDVSEVELAKKGTKSGRGANFVCAISGAAITPEYVKEHGKSSGFEVDLMAVAETSGRGRTYRETTVADIKLANSAQPNWRPHTPISKHPQYMGVSGYGYETFDQLFTERQLAGCCALFEALPEIKQRIISDCSASGWNLGESFAAGGSEALAYAEGLALLITLSLGKLIDLSNAFCPWEPVAQCPRNLFGRQAISMGWTFAEGNIFSSSSGGYATIIKGFKKSILSVGYNHQQGTATIVQDDARNVDHLGADFVVCTDPPYYDAVPYADLSDFFFPWHKKALKEAFPDVFQTISSPKQEEIVADRVRHGGAKNADEYFTRGLREVLQASRRIQDWEYPVSIYYAFTSKDNSETHTTSAGWVAFLEALISSGLKVVRTWPMRTEMTAGLKAKKNALATSVLVVCRKRDADAESVTRNEFLREVRSELPEAIRLMLEASIAPVDMAQAAIGPGMEVFSKYSAVLEADDRPMSIKTALQLINAELDEFLNDLHGDFDPDTRFAATWFEQNGFQKGEYGLADNIARARGIAVESVKHAGIIESTAGKVRILKRDELDLDWKPEEDTHLTIWECCQYLIRTLENDGEYAAAELLKKIGSERAEAVKQLAYYLYDVCGNKRQDAKEATSYNGLIAVWTDLTRLAATIHVTDKNRQTRMDI
ncbi:DUF1156 domain-containing protein [Aliiroseovarius crassostreae]|uniref:DUF1156 domain-containing protein n=1 Tax=Aliiroseovarius crassostreae TaxID=154981 RepID=UPI002207793A|nr:DUF1156 domain-containing protein [Aliiroseovarius crassostreae]UWQ08741.1 DUF1156 domain-containing protein [Aliiroseovarius crassostreae]